jgi:hypothetical protein
LDHTGLSAWAMTRASAFLSWQATEWGVENITFIDAHPTGKCEPILADATLAMC